MMTAFIVRVAHLRVAVVFIGIVTDLETVLSQQSIKINLRSDFVSKFVRAELCLPGNSFLYPLQRSIFVVCKTGSHEHIIYFRFTINN